MDMRILLPPSEGKTAPLQGPALDLPSLAFPELTDARRAVADKLVAASRSKNALSMLGVGERAFGEVHAQRNLYDMPCAPARSVYTGVLYEAAQLRRLVEHARVDGPGRGARHVVQVALGVDFAESAFADAQHRKRVFASGRRDEFVCHCAACVRQLRKGERRQIECRPLQRRGLALGGREENSHVHSLFHV